jgi:molybdate transport system ATP-binding protein
VTFEVDVERRLNHFKIQVRFTSDAPITALFGRSGAGKTSLINMISGLLRPARGRIVVDGRVLFDDKQRINVPPRKRRIGYIFQEARLFPHLTVYQNLLYGRWFTPSDKRYVDEDKVIALLDIAHLLNRRPAGLSGGEKQRVAIGRALLASPRLLLMDEPLASLDAAHKSDILCYIERLSAHMLIPIVYVSHSIEEITRLAHTLVVVSKGKVAAAGALSEITSRLDLQPLLGRYEAGAVIATCIVAHDERFGLTRLAFSGGELRAPRISMPLGATVRVHIRARDVAIALDARAGLSIQNVLPARIVEITHESGPYAEVRLDVNGAPLLARITKRSVHDLGLACGCAVFALIKSIALDRHSLGLPPAINHRPQVARGDV